MTPQIIFISISAVAGLIIIALITGIILETQFRKKLKKALDRPEAMDAFRESWPPSKLVKHSLRMERLAKIWGKSVISDTGIAPLWADKMETRPTKRALKRVLYHSPKVFVCRAFLTGLKNKRLTPVLTTWINETGPEQALRQISQSCRGEAFDGTEAHKLISPLLADNLDPIIEFTGASEWYTRYFAYKVLLHDQDKRSKRAAWDGFFDTHPLIRNTLAIEFSSDERNKLYTQLWELLLEDPSFEVRKSSKMRILQDFADLHTPSEKKLTGTPALRFLQLLEDGSPDEINIAMEFLSSTDLELRFPAASFLERNGILEKLLLTSTMEDRVVLERNLSMLKMALEVNVSSFLKKIGSNSTPGALLTAAKLLNQGGDRKMLAPLAEAIFSFFEKEKPGPEYIEIYTTLLSGIKKRGNDAALQQMFNEIKSRRNQEPFLELLLPAIPTRGDSLFIPLLIDFLKTDEFPSRETLITTLVKMPAELILPNIFEILDGNRADYSHTIRISCLRLLGRLKLPYCLQCILEYLPILPREEALEFAEILNEYPREEFEKKAAALFKTTDGQIRAALIRVLPPIENRTFIKEIRNALKDADPDVRIAAIEALLSFGEIRLLNQETSMLRDPVERVRLATARVIGEYGVPAALTVLEDILKDENETRPVIKAAIAGLGASATPESLNLLIGMLDQDLPYTQEIIAALSERQSKKDLMQLIENFRGGSPALKDHLIEVFKTQEKNAEPALLKLLEEQDDSLKAYIAEILHGTGYIGKTIRKLSHREIKIRKQAAIWLSSLESTASYRGLVLAARDPDQEIRVLVVKALERLNNPEGSEILEALKNDPDRRIRKYTLWAMERLKALALE
ncbi:MAG: HEAT repeat domain-containing protein [Spirochaetales bacterium]|nr:HEAT repeat domain-containing protein [Spirochaetales bacterium]